MCYTDSEMTRHTIILQDFDSGKDISQWEVTDKLFIPRRGDVIATGGQRFGIVGIARRAGTLVARLTCI